MERPRKPRPPASPRRAAWSRRNAGDVGRRTGARPELALTFGMTLEKRTSVLVVLAVSRGQRQPAGAVAQPSLLRPTRASPARRARVSNARGPRRARPPGTSAMRRVALRKRGGGECQREPSAAASRNALLGEPIVVL